MSEPPCPAVGFVGCCVAVPWFAHASAGTKDRVEAQSTLWVLTHMCFAPTCWWHAAGVCLGASVRLLGKLVLRRLYSELIQCTGPHILELEEAHPVFLGAEPLSNSREEAGGSLHCQNSESVPYLLRAGPPRPTLPVL